MGILQVYEGPPVSRVSFAGLTRCHSQKALKGPLHQALLVVRLVMTVRPACHSLSTAVRECCFQNAYRHSSLDFSEKMKRIAPDFLHAWLQKLFLEPHWQQKDWRLWPKSLVRSCKVSAHISLLWESLDKILQPQNCTGSTEWKCLSWSNSNWPHVYAGLLVAYYVAERAR